MGDTYLGDVRAMSFGFAPNGWVQCNGQLLPIEQNRGLFALLGNRYGGDGQTTFALPDLSPVSAQNGTALTWCIYLQGEALESDAYRRQVERAGYETILLGEVRVMPGEHVPDGWLPCQGQLMPIVQFVELFALIGTTYGGDGVRVFAMPDLPPLQGKEGSLQYCIATRGRYPSRPVPNTIPVNPVLSYVGETRMLAFDFTPEHWAPCQGQVMPIRESPALSILIGTTYGGDGESTFGLPDVAGLASIDVPLHVCISLDGIFPRAVIAPGRA